MLFLFLLRLLTGEVGRVEEERKLGLAGPRVYRRLDVAQYLVRAITAGAIDWHNNSITSALHLSPGRDQSHTCDFVTKTLKSFHYS